MAIAGPCVSTMEKPRSWINTSPETATLLFTRNTRKEHTGRLANLASHHSGLYALNIGHGQHNRSTWAEQSRMSSRPRGPCGSAMAKSLGCDAGAIPEADRAAALLR
jgi:hypothetical protein